MEIKPGQIWKHHKGDLYKIITLAKSKPNEENVVVYERQTDDHHSGWRVWTRSLDEFVGFTERGGQRIKRFELISES